MQMKTSDSKISQPQRLYILINYYTVSIAILKVIM